MLKTVLVTGAYGFLGRHSALLCAQQGYSVKGIGHGNWSQKEWVSWGLTEWHQGDVTFETLQQFGGDPYAILHFAGSGSVPLSFTSPWADFQRTVTTTANVLEFVRVYSPSTRVVYSSSASVYGIAKSFPISEESLLDPISPYGVHKLIAEQLVSSYASNFEVSAAVIRFFSIYGCGLRKQLLWDACKKLTGGEGTFMGTGNEVRDWLHVLDAASLISAAIDKATPDCPIVNGGTGEGVTIRDILNQLAENLRLTNGGPEFSGARRAGDPICYVADIARAKRWGWKPEHLLREKIKEYAEWWMAEQRRHGN